MIQVEEDAYYYAPDEVEMMERHQKFENDISGMILDPVALLYILSVWFVANRNEAQM